MIDQQRVGVLAAKLMEHVETEFSDDAELVRAVLIAEIRYPDDEDPTKQHTQVIWEHDSDLAGRVFLPAIMLRGTL